jgi:sugar phosphate isomerase/epimerase
MKIGIFSQSFSSIGLEEAIDGAAAIGFDGIELAALPSHLPLERAVRAGAEIARRIADAGLSVSAISLYTNFTEDPKRAESVAETLGFVDLAHVFDTRTIKITPGPPGSAEAADAHYAGFARAMEELCPAARDAGVRYVMETHLRMPSDTTAGTLRLLELGDPEVLGVNLDFCNVATGGDDPTWSIRQLAPRLWYTHVKDGVHKPDVTGPERVTWGFLGEGDVDYPAILRALRAVGYDGYLSIECLQPEARTDPIGTARRDFQTLRRLLAL